MPFHRRSGMLIINAPSPTLATPRVYSNVRQGYLFQENISNLAKTPALLSSDAPYSHLLVRISLLLRHLPRVHIPLARLQGLPARQGRHPIHEQLLSEVDALLLEHLCQALLLSLLPGRHERLGPLLADQVDLGLLGVADRQQGDGARLVDNAQAGVVPAHVALPVGVVGDVARGGGHGVVVCEGVEPARGRPAEVRVEGDAVGAVGIDG